MELSIRAEYVVVINEKATSLVVGVYSFEIRDLEEAREILEEEG